MSAQRSVVRLSGRLVRKGALVLAASVAAYLAIEIVSYLGTYPDPQSRASLGRFQENPAVRMLQGIPHGVDTVGGFVAWDGGWVLAGVTGVWAILTAARLLRGEEDAGRAELVLSGPLRASRAALLQLLVLLAAAVLVGAAAFAVLAGWGTGPSGSAALALGLAGFLSTWTTVSAVAAQVMSDRRRTLTVAMSAFGLAYLLRMVANSTDARGWLRWFTPFGWLDELRPYPSPNWTALVPLWTAPVLLAVATLALRTRRDDRGALIVGRQTGRSRLRLLGGPTAFAWRCTRGVLLGWALGLGAYGLVIGMLLKTVMDFLTSDPTYRRALEAMGMTLAESSKGFLGVMGVLLGLGCVLYACWRVGAVRAEEDTARAENLLVRPVARWRWLGGHLVVVLASAGLLAVACGLAMWAGALTTGGDVAAWPAVAATLNSLPVVVLFTGIAVLILGLVPRLTLPLSASLAAIAYVVELIGPALEWPDWAMNVSPFHHLAYVPAEPFALGAAVVTAVAGAAAAAAGLVAFQHRDLIGA